MASDLTAAEVVAAAAPVAGALGIDTIKEHTVLLLDDGAVESTVLVDFPTHDLTLFPDDAARLLVGMVAEKSRSYLASATAVMVLADSSPAEDYDGPRSLRTSFLATMRSFARAKGVE
jgi:hypothetical protein